MFNLINIHCHCLSACRVSQTFFFYYFTEIYSNHLQLTQVLYNTLTLSLPGLAVIIGNYSNYLSSEELLLGKHEDFFSLLFNCVCVAYQYEVLEMSREHPRRQTIA